MPKSLRPLLNVELSTFNSLLACGNRHGCSWTDQPSLSHRGDKPKEVFIKIQIHMTGTGTDVLAFEGF